MDPTIFGQTRLSWEWYNWGVYVAFLFTLAVALWILYDSQSKHKEAVLWRVVTVVATIFIIPSLVLAVDGRFSDSPLAARMLDAVDFLPYLGILGALGAIVALIGYVGGWGVEQYSSSPPPPLPPISVAPPPSPPPPPPEPVVAPTALPQAGLPGMPAGSEPGVPSAAKTEILRKPPAQLAWMVLHSGPRAGKEFRLGEVTNIGRDAKENDIPVDDAAMSRQHARVKLENDEFVLYDLASANHTYVNGEEIQKHVLKEGDRIKMGETEFAYMEVAAKDAKA